MVIFLAATAVELTDGDLRHEFSTSRTLFAGVMFVQFDHDISQGPGLD